MKLYIKFDINAACKRILMEQLEKEQLTYSSISFNEVELSETLSGDQLKHLIAKLSNYGIEIMESPKSILVQKIKDTIIEMIYMDEKLPTSKISDYLSEKLHYSYGYLSNIFVEVTYTSIENFIIFQKINRAKELIITNEFTITEIAYRLNYSSIAHFSNQFKNETGITPTTFQRIINKRRNSEEVE
ncbi:MAG: helix-turn-helix domain-containing protein [Prolixibacteraceae bacterium]|jgi:AraC-like DNA-binding protein